MNYQLPTTAPSTEVVAIETNNNISNNHNNNLTMNQSTTTTQTTMNNLTMESMSIQQMERYHYLSMYYGEETTIEILGTLVPLGINSWANLCKKIDSLTTGKEEGEAKYFSLIKLEITLGKHYSPGMIIQIISKIRKEQKLKPYLKNIYKSCLNDFLQQHMAEAILSEDVDPKTNKKTVIAYKPIVDLKY